MAQLVEQGVVESYPEGAFKGEKKITRFEMAQMVGKAISIQNHVDTDQMVIIHRLSKEFAPELRNLGVNVGKNRLNASFSRGYLLGGFRTTFDSEFKLPVSVYQLNYKPSQHVAATGFYVTVYDNQYDNVFGGSLDVALGGHNKVWLGGEYVREEHNTAYGESWTAGVGYGEAQITKPHTWGAKVQYFKVGADGPIVANRWKLRHIQNIDYRGYLATLDYTLAKNVGLSVYGTFRSQRALVYLNDTHEYLGADVTYAF